MAYEIHLLGLYRSKWVFFFKIVRKVHSSSVVYVHWFSVNKILDSAESAEIGSYGQT